jgi:hypothetical protein
LNAAGLRDRRVRESTVEDRDFGFLWPHRAGHHPAIPQGAMTMRYLYIAALQCAALAVVFWVWREIAPTVGLIGLTIWAAGCYALAWRWERQNRREWMDEYARRFRKRA